MEQDEQIKALKNELEKMVERYHDLRKLAYRTSSGHLLRLVDEAFLCAPEDAQKLLNKLKDKKD